MPGILPRLAQYELTLLDWVEANKGAAKYVAMANKCWPAFQTEFGFVPCYVNSRLTAMGIPTACEVDIYGALSEFIGTCVTGESVTLLDINNSVPADMYKASIEGKYPYRHNETFMGFHCGNTPMCRLVKGTMKYQLIMKRSLEPDKEPDITRGTLEGDIVPGPITFYRLQANKDSVLQAYVAQGEDPARGHRVLWRHRRVRHPGDEPLLPPCADRRRLSAPRRGGLRPSRQGPVQHLQDAGRGLGRLQPAQGRALSVGEPLRVKSVFPAPLL